MLAPPHKKNSCILASLITLKRGGNKAQKWHNDQSGQTVFWGVSSEQTNPSKKRKVHSNTGWVCASFVAGCQGSCSRTVISMVHTGPVNWQPNKFHDDLWTQHRTPHFGLSPLGPLSPYNASNNTLHPPVSCLLSLRPADPIRFQERSWCKRD